MVSTWFFPGFCCWGRSYSPLSSFGLFMPYHPSRGPRPGGITGWSFSLLKFSQQGDGGEHKASLHPGRLTWNLTIHPWKRKIIFRTIIFRFYVNLEGCKDGLKVSPSKKKVGPKWIRFWWVFFVVTDFLSLDFGLWMFFSSRMVEGPLWWVVFYSWMIHVMILLSWRLNTLPVKLATNEQSHDVLSFLLLDKSFGVLNPSWTKDGFWRYARVDFAITTY